VHVAILAKGDTPRHAAPRAAFAEADLLVACDGAFAAARALGREPDYVVGDGDSLTPADRKVIGDRFVRVAEQDTNDLCKAFRYVRDLPRIDPVLSITLLGTTGRREDHALANIFHLLDFTEEVPDTKIITDDGTFTAVRGEQTFPCRPGDAVSVFAPLPYTRVTSSGLAWPLDHVDLTPLWRGTLNRTTSDSFTLRTSHPILLYRPY
jgi:thiamine pyrophosphokinase